MLGLVGADQPLGELGVEVGRRGEAAAGQERGLQIAVGSLDQPLASGSASQHWMPLMPSVQREAFIASVSRGRPTGHCSTADSLSLAKALCTRPPAADQRPMSGRQIRL